MHEHKKKIGDKQNMLSQNIITNSQNHSRRKLSKLNMEKVGSVQQKTKLKHRYQQQNKNIPDAFQLPTFGDWKAQFKMFGKTIKNSTENQHISQCLDKTISTQEQQKSNERVQRYQQIKLKELFDTNKLKQTTIDNINTRRFVSSEHHDHSKKKTFSNRARALSKQFQTHFQTIDSSLHRIVNRKQIFKNLYLKQKQKYEEILRKYSINQKVDDSQFENYFKY